MPERAQARSAPNKTAPLQITPVSGRTSLLLKSWLPEYTNGGRPVILAGHELPSQVGGILSGPIRALCIGPGEWVIAWHEYPASGLRQHIEPDLSRLGLVLVGLTDGLVVFEVRGPAARDVLSKGCGLDFHPRVFPAGRCARTRFAQIPVLIECLEQPSRFELYVARSYSGYLHAWLTDATVEFEQAAQHAFRDP